jgi:DNA-binding transcriptional ArsR family regulator
VSRPSACREAARLSVGDLAAQLPVTRPAVSQHLKVLKDAGLVSEQAVGTRRIKPREHNLLRAQIVETVCEPRAVGHIYDRASDGSECRWARILAFEPPDRVVFSWDIGPTWQVETNPELTSEVEVRFFAEAPELTRVELEHRNIDRHGSGWESVRDGVDSDGGWPLYLQRYVALFDRGA